MGMVDFFGDDSEWERLQEINKGQSKKDNKCKYCEKPVMFYAVGFVKDPFDATKETIKWQCLTLKGQNHSSLCLGSPDYNPKFTKGDVILSQWKEHATMYIVGEVDIEEGIYDLIYQKKRHNRKSIPIKTIDKKSSKCNGEMVEAIFGT